MQIQSSGMGSTSGYSAAQSTQSAQSAQSATRPLADSGAAQGGQQGGGGAVQAGGGGNQPVQDPNATRGRIVNITA
jgi:hypothetical protein